MLLKLLDFTLKQIVTRMWATALPNIGGALFNAAKFG